MKYNNLDIHPEFLTQFRMYFHSKTLKSERITHDLNHDLILYCSHNCHNAMCMPEDQYLQYTYLGCITLGSSRELSSEKKQKTGS